MTDMRRRVEVIVVVLALAAGFVTGLAVAKKAPVDPALYVGQEPHDAAVALLTISREQAMRKGTWEKIAVGRLYVLGGMEDEGWSLIEEVAAGKTDASDWMRIGRVYHEAGNWPKAREAFERVLELKPEDEDRLVDIGAHFNVAGDRERAEELFQRSFAEDSDNWENLAIAGSSYLGVMPRR
jgi:tetratricopeptide (TPR) repeat protein